jgi:hypothetical protein
MDGRSSNRRGMDHIFTDESGGSDRGVFLVSAIQISALAADRLIRTFRKKTKIHNEIKGQKLLPDQRHLFFGLLRRESDAYAVSIACSRTTTLGGWAMSHMDEHLLWSALTVESCLGLPGGVQRINVTTGGGKYSHPVLDECRLSMVEAMKRHRPNALVNMTYSESHASAGVQIADVIANTVFQFQSNSNTPAANLARELLQPLLASSRLVIREPELREHRPTWIDPDKGRDKNCA